MLKLQEVSFDWAKNHVLRHGDTDIFPTPFEFAAIEYDWDELKQILVGEDIQNWNIRPHRALLAPKAKYGFRIVTQLDPLDFIIFSGLIYEIGSDIESRRIRTGKHKVFSYRFLPTEDGQIFNPEIGYKQFQQETQRILDSNGDYSHIAITDISDFYMRIYHHRLDNALQGATSKENHIRALKHLLAGWNNTETFGIPVGNAPSRLLAEITISDIDDALIASRIRFVRFNDDYRIFLQESRRSISIPSFSSVHFV